MNLTQVTKGIGQAMILFSLLAYTSEAQTVSTPIVGFSKLSISAGGRLISPVFNKASKYQGSAVVSSGVFTVSGLTANALVPTAYNDRPNYPTHYVKITSGSYEGLVLDVTANSATTITVADAPTGLSGSVSVIVIPHYTLLDLANQSANLAAYSDAVTFYDSGNNKRTYYYTGGTDGFIADDYSTPANNVVIYPGSGVIVNTTANSSVTMSGNVNTTKTIVPIFAGESIVSPIDPSGVSKVAGINLAAALSPYTDSANAVLLNGTLATSTFYSDGVDILNDSYDVVPLASSPAVSSGNGFIVNAVADSQWVQPAVTNQ